MRKGDLVDLIKYHYDGDENSFKNMSYDIAKYFSSIGDDEIARYVLALINNKVSFSVQDFNDSKSYFTKIENPSNCYKLPKPIENDFMGILNAMNNNSEVHRFLFVGESGTGKTEGAKQIARILNKELYSVKFAEIIDSKLGQTSKNLIDVFNEIKNIRHPEKYIILFDEIDALALDRINSNDLREMGRVTSTLLKELDDLNNKITLIATSNLYKKFDKALLRRFDYIVDFNRYSNDDLIDIALSITEEEIKKYKNLKFDKAILTKIFNLKDVMPYPGDLKNIIKSSIAFSNLSNSYAYLLKLYNNILSASVDTNNIKELTKNGFTIREIEKITGISKSSVQRGIYK